MEQAAYTVYMMTLVKTGEFYIGLTTNFQKRQQTHRTRVYTMCRSLRIGHRERGCLPCYKTMAIALIKGKRYAQINRDILKGITFSSLFETSFPQEGKQFEHLLLFNHMNNPLCLNVQKESRYKPRQKHVTSRN